MELAALYERPVAQNLALSLYLAPVGEPAVGPVAFPHRPSAADDPLAPISHHWQDGTHITFGVVTAGVFTREVKLEASWFNGREPDENRTNFDYTGRRLDSYSARLTVNPGSCWRVRSTLTERTPSSVAPSTCGRTPRSLFFHRFPQRRSTMSARWPSGTSARSAPWRGSPPQ